MNLHSQQHVLVMCATAFYLVENYPLDVGPDFSASIIQVTGLAPSPWGTLPGRTGARGRALTRTPPLAQMCGVMLSGSEEATPSTVYHCVLRGLERLLLSEQLSRLDAESLVKLSVDRVNVHSPHRAMAALGLMLTCMYTGEGDTPTRVSCRCSPGRGPQSPRFSRAVQSDPCRVAARASHPWSPGLPPGAGRLGLADLPCGSGASAEPGQPPRRLAVPPLVSGKEKASPGRTSEPGPAAPDSESVIVAMERVSVLFDR